MLLLLLFFFYWDQTFSKTLDLFCCLFKFSTGMSNTQKSNMPQMDDFSSQQICPTSSFPQLSWWKLYQMHWSKTSEAPGLFLFIPIVNLLGKAKGFSFKIYSHLISSPSSSYHWFDPGQHNFLARLMKSFPIRPKNMFYSEKKTNSS